MKRFGIVLFKTSGKDATVKGFNIQEFEEGQETNLENAIDFGSHEEANTMGNSLVGLSAMNAGKKIAELKRAAATEDDTAEDAGEEEGDSDSTDKGGESTGADDNAGGGDEEEE